MDSKSAAPKFFPTQFAFRKWLVKNHNTSSELLVGYYKINSGRKSITWPQSVDEALCFGWIDGLRKSIDDLSYTIRFTPRRNKSIWSAVNTRRAKELIHLNLMMPPGIEAFNKRNEKRTRQYSFEQRNVALKPAYERRLRANKRAWTFFQSLAPSTRKPSMWWVMSAKKEETRLRRLDILINVSERRELIPPLKLLMKSR